MDFLFLRLESSNRCQDQSTGPSVRGFLLNVSTILYPSVHNNVMIVVIFFSTDKLSNPPTPIKKLWKKNKKFKLPSPVALRPPCFYFFIFYFFILFVLVLTQEVKCRKIWFLSSMVWFLSNELNQFNWEWIVSNRIKTIGRCCSQRMKFQKGWNSNEMERQMERIILRYVNCN